MGFGFSLSTPFYPKSVWAGSQVCYCIPVFIVGYKIEEWVHMKFNLCVCPQYVIKCYVMQLPCRYILNACAIANSISCLE